MAPESTGVAQAGRWVSTVCSRDAALVEVKSVAVARPSEARSSRFPAGGPAESAAGGPSAEGAWPVELLILSPDQVCKGFSGGPVLNMRGEVIGVVRAAVRGRRSGQGLRRGLEGQWVDETIRWTPESNGRERHGCPI